ncbi:DEAD box helicase, putative [Plasmodium knowlesi strain H]|uniref:DEAD box helicase, putative n=3 Tax=Plasmodium knowlesi TaxID=5850 RepID=A0A5K1U4H1_PLAKH|nr:DEAD box helicase, putative [Plasmodium knowlesi strain H]OTN63756.1 putative DEAD box helicase [Plasmodium knowlesi]CAA9990740.1 DEAD box helicase, putative [Plasmodium knowlesi strain H]SBO21179.1 DEAD box helicase, putative [Plasmodium knowlesi strain H]SBO21635.1 DEAD box helicase, putative [Plasmodium knowlesi strain H]VVS80214.1 DEAD box helicase, putative [Plasmodium knowlesi strain H]|eukprot:XP_002262029.1 DEAD box helicase, putative [Plasmodium knowlesi strain H]
MENYLTAFFLLLKSVLSNSNRVRTGAPRRYLLFFVFLNTLVATKWITGGRRHSNWNFIRRGTAPVRTKFVLKSGNKGGVDNISWVKKKHAKDSDRRKNIVLIQRGVNIDTNRIRYTGNILESNSSVQEIKHLSNLQKNVIYLLERNNNILVHAKTSSGKTTICLLYLILKFYYNSEFIFDEDIEREKYLNSDEYLNSYKKMLLLNGTRKKVQRSKLKYTPFSEKYAQICDIREDTDLLMEKRARNVLKKGEKILILCPSKELCVQISQNILSLMSGKDEGAIRLFIDKDGREDDNGPKCVSSWNLSNDVGIKEENGEEAKGRSADIGGVPTLTKCTSTNDLSKRTTNLRDNLFLIGTPICFKNFLLSLSKENLKDLLQKIKYVFFDEIDRMFPALKTRKSRGRKNSTKKKTAYFILETIMYMNKKNLVFVGCSSTLNRELHRRIFKLLSLNRNNAKKKIYLLRESNSSSNGDTSSVEGNPVDTIHPDSPHWGDTFNEPPTWDTNQERGDPTGGDKIVTNAYQEKENIHVDDYADEDERACLFTQNGEDMSLQKYIIKVRLPNSIRHLYSVVKDQLYSSKMEEAYKIVKHFKNRKVLILVKNGFSLLTLKRYLSERNIFSVLLHEELQISLTGNNKHLDRMCQQYAHIKDLKETVLQNEEEIKRKYINKYPVIISSFDSIRGFHINNLEFVLLCSRPKNVNEYIHLSGRVGRRNNIGYSILLEDERNVNIVTNWLTNIRVRFSKLALNGAISADVVSTDNLKQPDNSAQNGSAPDTDRGKDNLNYITSCIMDELNENLP